MEIYEMMFTVAFNVLSIYVNVRVIQLFLKPRQVKGSYALGIYVAVWLLNSYVYCRFQIDSFTIFSMFFLLLVIAFLLFQGSILKKVLAVAASQSLSIISESLVWRLFYYGDSHGRKSTAFGVICSSLFMFIIVIVVEKKCILKSVNSLPAGYYILLFFIFGGSAVLANFISEVEFSNNWMPTLSLSLICLMDVAYFYLCEKTQQIYQERIEKITIEQQLKMYTHQFELFRQSQQNLKSLRHDMKNHILMLVSYFMEGKSEEALRYVEEIEKALQTKGEYARTGNQGIDSVINYMLGRKNLTEYDVKLKLNVPEKMEITDFDLNIILGNLLENALEASEKTSKKELSIQIKYQTGILLITVNNSFDGVIEKKGNKILSRKSMGNHGIGLSNVQRIVEKYSGTFHVDVKEDKFVVTVMLYV